MHVYKYKQVYTITFKYSMYNVQYMARLIWIFAIEN